MNLPHLFWSRSPGSCLLRPSAGSVASGPDLPRCLGISPWGCMCCVYLLVGYRCKLYMVIYKPLPMSHSSRLTFQSISKGLLVWLQQPTACSLQNELRPVMVSWHRRQSVGMAWRAWPHLHDPRLPMAGCLARNLAEQKSGDAKNQEDFTETYWNHVKIVVWHSISLV